LQLYREYVIMSFVVIALLHKSLLYWYGLVDQSAFS
jgi:hypothetical protein